MENNSTEFYWCVNCGYNGKYGIKRTGICKCQKCNYDPVTPYDLEEIMQDEHLQFKFKEYLSADIIISGS